MRLKITVDGKLYEVDVEVAEPEPPPTLRYVGTGGSATGAAPSHPVPRGGAAGAAKQPADEGKACRSPLSGVVSEVHVTAGQEVALDQPVIVLEAMKMFTTITSPVAGKVKEVSVAPGGAVKQGELLLEFE